MILRANSLEVVLLVFRFLLYAEIHDSKHDDVGGDQDNKITHFFQADDDGFDQVPKLLKHSQAINASNTYQRHHEACQVVVELRVRGKFVIIFWQLRPVGQIQDEEIAEHCNRLYFISVHLLFLLVEKVVNGEYDEYCKNV